MTPPALLKAVRSDAMTDTDLLLRFARDRDEPAFAELVRRYGPLVFGVCRRATGHSQDAEDAFQAVFLVLARRAGDIRQPGRLAGWLHGTAVRIGRKAKRRAARRREVSMSMPERPVPAADVSDLSPLIDAELHHLPEWYRLPVLLCDVQGVSRADAAVRLGVPEGTVSSRLAAGRKRLAERLTKRGVTLGAGGLLATVPGGLSARAVEVAVRWAAGGAVPAAVGSLAGAGGRVMRAVLLAASFGIAIGLGAAAGGPSEEPKKLADPPKAEARSAEKAEPKPAAIGRPKMRQMVDLDHAPQSMVWYKMGDRDGLLVAVSGAGRGKDVVRILLGDVEPVVREVKTFKLAAWETFLESSAVGNEHLFASVRKEIQGINAVHQLNVRSLARDVTTVSIPLDPTTGREIRLTADGIHAMVRLESPPSGGAEPKSIVQRLDLRTGEPDGAELVVPGGLASVAFSADGRSVFGVTRRELGVRCWEFPSGKEVWSYPLPREADRLVLALSADGRTIAVAATKQTINAPTKRPGTPADDIPKLLDSDFGTGLFVLQTADGRAVRVIRTPTADDIQSVSVSFDGRLAVIQATVTDMKREGERQYKDRDGNMRSVPGPITLDRKWALRVYDTSSGVALQEWKELAQVAFAPDRNVLAVAEAVDTRSGQPATGRIGFWHFDAPAKK